VTDEFGFTGTPPAALWCSSDQHRCPCGYYGDPTRDCTCPAGVVSRYQRRISGPLLDRIDLFVDVPRVAYEKLASTAKAESSGAVAERVEAARLVQHRRFAPEGGTTALNSEMNPSQVRDHAQLQMTEPATGLLKLAVEQLNLSARAFHRVLKLARTIADLAGSEGIDQPHLAESIQYRERAD
jgi:magnesium chelatase family protein